MNRYLYILILNEIRVRVPKTGECYKSFRTWIAAIVDVGRINLS